jgi:hypothetical protein
MSWQDIMQRVLPPIGGVLPHITSPFGEVEGRPPSSTKPHRAVDFNYIGGQSGINLTHPALRSPVTGIVTKAGQDKYGTITIRDANGFSHTILHTDSQHVTVGDPVAAGQLIGTMGNTGAVQQHVHYQLKDPGGNLINPSAFWDQQGPVEPIPNPPAYLQEYQKYLQTLGRNATNGFGNAPDVANAPAMPFVQQGVPSSDHQDPFGGRFGNWGSSPARILPLPSDRPFDNRFGNWGSAPAGDPSDGNSPLLRALEKYRRSAAPDGSVSVAVAPSSAPPALYRSTTDADESRPAPPIRRLVGRILDDPRTSAFDTGVPAAPSPSKPFLFSDRGDSFDDRFGNSTSTGTEDMSRQSQDSAPSYSDMFRQYLNQLTAGQSQAPAPSSNVNTPNPYQLPRRSSLRLITLPYPAMAASKSGSLPWQASILTIPRSLRCDRSSAHSMGAERYVTFSRNAGNGAVGAARNTALWN